jgi:hypothetical protein
MITHHVLYPPTSKSRRSYQSQSQNRLPATTRGRKSSDTSRHGAGAVRLSPLYQELLKEIYAVGYMRTDQVEQMLRILATRTEWPLRERALRRVVQKKLLTMVRAGLLTRIMPPVLLDTRSGPPMYIYTLARAGAFQVAESLGLKLHDLGWRPTGDESFLFLNHSLTMVDYKLDLFAACLSQNVTLAKWVGDRILRKEPARVDLTGRDGEQMRVSVVPDAFYQLRLPSGQTLSCCLEIDMGTSTVAPSKWQVKSWWRKILAYRALQEQDLADSSWTTKGFIVTTVTTSASRMAHLQSVCERAGGKQHFWFTTFERLSAETLLGAPVWFVAGKGDQRHSLLPRR